MMSRSILLTATLAVFLGPAHAAVGQSLGCKRAVDATSDLRRGLATGALNLGQVLSRARELMQICPESAEVFRIAACCAEALGDTRAEGWRSRAVLNRAPTTACHDLTPGASGAPTGPAVAAPPGPVRRKFALLVGIGSFADTSIPRLNYPAKDAQDLARTLIDPQVGRFKSADVKVLVDSTATRGAILDALQSLILQAQADDLVVLFVSSHGSPNRSGAGLAGVGYILAHDTSSAGIWRDGLEYRSFADKVELIRARRKVLFLDTCFSGQGARGPAGAKAMSLGGVGLSAATANMFLSGEGTYVVSSSRDDEQSWESDTLRNGYFSHFLIDALKRGSEPPTLADVFAHLERNVPTAVARDKGAPQHPVMFPRNTKADLRVGVATANEGSDASSDDFAPQSDEPGARRYATFLKNGGWSW
jgi:hypothetical protein